jgi:hypothetical protein
MVVWQLFINTGIKDLHIQLKVARNNKRSLHRNILFWHIKDAQDRINYEAKRCARFNQNGTDLASQGQKRKVASTNCN